MAMEELNAEMSDNAAIRKAVLSTTPWTRYKQRPAFWITVFISLEVCIGSAAYFGITYSINPAKQAGIAVGFLLGSFLGILFVVLPLFYILKILFGKLRTIFSSCLDSVYHCIATCIGLYKNTGSYLSPMEYGCMSEDELKTWLEVVESYTKPIQSRLAQLTRCQFDIEHTGSIVERLGKSLAAMPFVKSIRQSAFTALRTDHDIMFVLKDASIAFEDRENVDVVATATKRPQFFHMLLKNTDHCLLKYFTVDSDVLSNGRCRTMLATVMNDIPLDAFPAPADIEVLAAIHEVCGMANPSITSVSSYGLRKKFEVLIKGPSVNFTIEQGNSQIYECDFLFSLPCPDWPPCAGTFLSRRRSWPSTVVISDLRSRGCHFVPKPAELEEREEDPLAWRLSFSLAEVLLAQQLPDTARLCYLGLKHIYKKHLKSVCKSVKSYHLKTLLFWFVEQERENIDSYWNNKNIELIFIDLCEHVIKAIEQRKCPHYFIDDLNLFQGENLKDSEFRKFTKRMTDVQKKPRKYLHDPAISGFKFWTEVLQKCSC